MRRFISYVQGLVIGLLVGTTVGIFAGIEFGYFNTELDFRGDTTSGPFIKDRMARVEGCGYDGSL